MDRREFVRGSLVGVGGLSGFMASVRRGVAAMLERAQGGGPVASKGSRAWAVSNKYVEIVLGAETKGGLISLVDMQSKRNFITSKPRPLYELLLFEKGKELVELSSLDAESLKVDRSSAAGKEMLTLSYGRHRALDLRVTCTVVLEADSPLSQWRISIQNNTSYGVRAIRFPVVVSPSVLGESDEDDYFISGSWGGHITHRPGRSGTVRRRAEFRADGGRGPSWLPNQYPGTTAVQLQAYYDQTAGLYLATYDNAGNIKSFGLTRLEDGLDLSIEHNYDERSRFNFELPYDTVLGVFHGDWYRAADIYKDWAQQQHWCSKRVAERTDLPDWLKEPRPWPAIISRGNYARLGGGLAHPAAEYPIEQYWPASKVVPLMRQYAYIFHTPVVTWMEGWEYVGAPGGPVDIFPLEGEESFKAAMADLTRDGNHPFMYLAGLHWCYKRPMIGYDEWGRFEREGRKMASLDDQGELMLSDINKRTYGNGQKYFVAMCTGQQDMQDLWVKNFLYLMDLGAVALQLDQQIGYYPQVCYSDQHGHAPGYGPWMHQRMLEFVRRVRSEARKKNPKTTLSVEGPCEIWIQEHDLAFHRPYSVGSIPLFDYLYHEYAISYGGDGEMGVCHPDASTMKHAYLLVYGLQNCVGIGEEEYKFTVNPDYPVLRLLRNICEAQRTYAHDYVVFGKMLRPTELKVGKVTADLFRRPGTVGVPRVVHGVWKAPDGKIGYVLANWTGDTENVVLRLVEDQEARAKGEVFLVTARERKAALKDEVLAGQLTLTIPPRSVLLVEQS